MKDGQHPWVTKNIFKVTKNLNKKQNYRKYICSHPHVQYRGTEDVQVQVRGERLRLGHYAQERYKLAGMILSCDWSKLWQYWAVIGPNYGNTVLWLVLTMTILTSDWLQRSQSSPRGSVKSDGCDSFDSTEDTGELWLVSLVIWLEYSSLIGPDSAHSGDKCETSAAVASGRSRWEALFYFNAGNI